MMGINDDLLLPRVVELRQLVGASTLSKGLSSHSVIRNAAKEEVRFLVMIRVPELISDLILFFTHCANI